MADSGSEKERNNEKERKTDEKYVQSISKSNDLPIDLKTGLRRLDLEFV